MATLYKTDGTVQEIQPKNGKDFKLDQLQALVGGYIEIVSLESKPLKIMVVNEDGKGLGLPINEKATEVARPFIQFYDCIVGDALVCLSKEVQ